MPVAAPPFFFAYSFRATGLFLDLFGVELKAFCEGAN